MRLLYFLLVCTTALLLNEANAYNGDEYSTCISQLRHEVRKQNQIRKSKIQECKTLQENGGTNEAVHGRGQNPEERPVQVPQTDENRRRLEQPALQHSWDRSTEAPRRSYYDEERQRQEAENRWQEEQRRRQEEEARRWEDTKRRQEEIQRQEEANRRREEQIRRQEEEERGLRNRHREEEATSFTPSSNGEEEAARRLDDQKRRQEEATRRWEEEKRRQEEEERGLRNRHREEEPTSFTPSSTGEEEAARRLDDQRRRQEEATRRWEEEKRRQEEEERGLRNRHREEGVTSFIPFSAGNYVPNVKVPKFPPGFPFPPKCDRIPDVPGLEFPEGISSGYTSSRITTTKTHETFLCSDPRFQEEFYMAKTTLTTNSEDGVLQNSNNSNANYYYQNKQPFDWSPDVRVESPF